MLGAGMLFVGPVAAGLAALLALRAGTDRGFAVAALAVSAVEVFAVIALVAIATATT